jgi:Cu2+-exporting ATPase
VYEILHRAGLDGYYRMAERRAGAVASTDRRYDEVDHPSYHQHYVTRRRDGLLESSFYLEGVACGSCVWLIERAPMLLPGLVSAELDMRRSRVNLAWDDSATRLSHVARTLDTLGYPPHPLRGLRREDARRREDRAALARIGVAGAASMNVMLAALALYSGWFTGMEPAYERTFRWLSLLLTTPVLLWPGKAFFRGAWGAIRTGSLHMDLPIAIALAAGYGRGLVNTVRDAGPVYFDGVTLLVFLLLVGRTLQQRAQRAAWDSTEILHGLSPSTARVTEGDLERVVPVGALLPGMIVRVRAEEPIPADGIVQRGRSTVDLSLLTGESRPAAVALGDSVFAGTTNRGSQIDVRVVRTGEESRLGRILREAEASSRRRAPILAKADRLAGAFVATVLALAAITLAIWWSHGSSTAVDNAIALLIVTCPCALALATPLALTASIGRAGRAGLLVKSGAALEALGRPGVIYLDKTGTLTEGRMSLTTWSGPESAKPLVLALEEHASHPIARGFQEAWRDVPVETPAREVRYTAGGGLEGSVSGRWVVVGSPAFVKRRAAPAGGAWRAAAPQGQPVTGTPVHVAIDGRWVGHATFGDAIRPEASRTLRDLEARGYRPCILSGDDPAIVRAVGAALGLPPEAVRGGATPEEKLLVIEEAERKRRVVMVGDGVNDAAAMARATVGVGVSGGAEACLASADVYLSRPGLDALVDLVDGARRTIGVIHRSILFSVAYNLVGVGLAMSGLINPLVAAVLMPLSSITVILASWKGRTFQARP